MKVFLFYSLAYFVCLVLRLFFTYYIDSWPLSVLVIRVVIPIEFACLGLFYFYNIKSRIKKPILIFSNIIFILHSIYDFYITKKGEDYSYTPVVIECLFFLFVIPYFFYEKMQYSVAKPIYQSPAFWVSVGFLIYFAGNFFQLLLSRDPVLYNDAQFTIISSNIYDSLTILKNLLLCVAIYVNNTQERQTILPKKIPISIDLDIFKPNKNKN